MADIELVIKIPEEDYNRLVYIDMFRLRGYIENGVLLPKGHGRLIDVNELEECKEIMNTISGESKYAVRMDDIRNAGTIIEADKESEE